MIQGGGGYTVNTIRAKGGERTIGGQANGYFAYDVDIYEGIFMPKTVDVSRKIKLVSSASFNDTTEILPP